MRLDRRAALAMGAAFAAAPGRPRAADIVKLKAVYPTRSVSAWSLYAAREAGIYAKHGLDVTLEFGIHPVGIAGLISGEVQFSNYSLDDVAAATVRDPVLIMQGSCLNKSQFALMAKREITAVEGLRGKRIAVGRVGDPPYHYTVGLLRLYGLNNTDVQWVPTGADASARVTMLTTGQVDAALLSGPSWYRLEAAGLKPLTRTDEHDDLYISTGYTFKKTWAAANQEICQRLMHAHTEAVHLLYTDQAAAVAAYRKYDPSSTEADVIRLHKDTIGHHVLDRIPLMLEPAVAASVDRIGNDVPQAKKFDFQKIMDMRIVRSLIADGVFEKLYGPGILPEQEARLKIAWA